MNVAAGPELAAAVSNAGGLGVIGGLGYTPAQLTEQCKKIKLANLRLLRADELLKAVRILCPRHKAHLLERALGLRQLPLLECPGVLS